MARSVVMLMLLAAPLGCAQTGYQSSDRLKTETERNVVSLSAKLKEVNQPTALDAELESQCKVNCSDSKLQTQMAGLNAQRLRASNEFVAQIHQSVDAYMVGTLNGHVVGISTHRVAQDLKQILGKTAVAEPAAFLLESPHGSTLAVFYAIGAGTAITSSTTLRAYDVSGNQVKLAGATGSDMDGYGNLWVKRLQSSEMTDELWLLVGGQAFGANGPNIRMRIYAYDGETFATRWMPANVWGTFTVMLTEGGFRIDGQYYQGDKDRHDAYLIGKDGLYLCRPRQCQ